MSNLSKRTTAALIMFLFLASFSQGFAQEEKDKWDQFKQEKMDYFNEKMDLTEKEKEAFWPIYDDHFNRITKIHEDERSLLSYFKTNADYLSEEEVDETIKKNFDLQQKKLDLEIKYHEKFVKAIGKKKTMIMYTLERDYRMHVLRKFRGGQGQGRNQVPGKGRNRAGNINQ